jgi:hypothetical protein
MKKIFLFLFIFFIGNHLFGSESSSKIFDQEQSQKSTEKSPKKRKEDCEKRCLGKDNCSGKDKKDCKAKCCEVSNTTIELTFKKNIIELNDLKSYNKIKIGDFYKIKVSGINQINYQVLISQKDTLVNDALSLPSFSDFNLEAISSALAAVDLSKANVGPEVNSKSEKNDISKKQKVENTNQKKFSDDLTKGRELLSKIDFSIVASDNHLNIEVIKIENYYWDIKKVFVKSRTSAVNVSVNNKLDSVKCMLDAINHIQKKFTVKNQIDEYLSVEEVLRDSLLSVDVEGLSEKAEKQHTLNLKAFGELVKAREKVFLNLATFQSNIKKSKEAISGDTWQNTMVALSLIENLQDPTYISLPIQYLGERTKTTITISPRDPNYKLNSYSTSFVFPIEKVPYFGVSSSFYYSGMKSDRFSFQKMANSDSILIVNEEMPKSEIGTAILAKFGRKISQKVGYHGSLGLGISFTDNIRPRVLAGGGLTFGSKNSLAIDVGVIGGQVDRLSSAYNLTDSYTSVPENVTVTKLDASYFFSVGYFFRF